MKNRVGKLLSETAENNRLRGRSANHSVWETWISSILNLNVPGDYVAHLNDYPNLKILDSYNSPSVQHQRRMSFTPSPSANLRATSTSPRFFMFRENKVKASLWKVASWAYSMELSLKTTLSKIQVMDGSLTKMTSKIETSRKHRLILKEAILWAGLQSFTDFGVQMM